MAKTNIKSKKIIVLILMMLALATIYVLPYLRYTFYIPLQEAMNLVGENKKYGMLTSIYGIANFLLYIPGGWMADRFDPKKLMVFSMVSTGALGLWLSTWPGYTTLLLIYALFGITTVLTFWSASIKCINVISASDEQGSMFGGLEAGRGIVTLLVTTVFLGVYAVFQADSAKAMSAIVITCSLVMILVGVALAFCAEDQRRKAVTNTNTRTASALWEKRLRCRSPIFWPVCFSAHRSAPRLAVTTHRISRRAAIWALCWQLSLQTTARCFAA